VDSAAQAELQKQMARLALGDRFAFLPVYEALWPVLREFIGRQMPPSDSEDVAQEALLKIFARASELDPERDALSWALGIATFEIRTVRKRILRRREERVPALPQVASADSVEQQLVARDLEAAAREALGTLRPSDIETLKLVATGRLPPVPRATFRKRVERALKRFKLAWRAKHGTG